MPNWCSNVLVIRGPKTDLDKFRQTLSLPDENGDNAEFAFYQTVPRSENADWYEWNNKNWGSKWDACESSVQDNEMNIRIHFNTAWRPPIAWGNNVVSLFPGLEFDLAYCEMGNDFYGLYKVGNDDTIEESWVMSDCYKNTDCEDSECDDQGEG